MSGNAATLARAQQVAGIKSEIRHQLFIGGQLVDAADGETLTTYYHPHDNSAIGEVSTAGKADIDKAVAAARGVSNLEQHERERSMALSMVWAFGGVGQSGYGRDMGFEAMRENTQVKSVWVNIDAQIPRWYPR